jgi:hypothetical protein
MSNDFYNVSGYPANSADGRSIDLRAELARVATGFDKFPPLVGNALDIVTVNASETGLTTLPYAISTWVPVVTCVTPGNLTIVYSVQAGHVVRIGAFILLTFRIGTTTFTHTTASGDVIITGVPFAHTAVDAAVSTGAMQLNVTKATYTQFPIIMISASGLKIGAIGSGVANSTVAITNCPTGTQLDWYGSVCYRTDAP